MKWYGILAILFLLGGLAGITVLGMNTDKTESFFGKPSFISNQSPSSTSQSSSASQSNPPQPQKADKNICQQWQQELINVRVQKSLTDTRYLDSSEFQSLLGKEYNLDQKLKFRCR